MTTALIYLYNDTRLIVLRARRRAFLRLASPWVSAFGLVGLYAIVALLGS